MSRARCPRCGGIFEMPSELPKRRVRCPECGSALRASRRFGIPLFHVYVLPALWLLAVVPLWIHMWGNRGVNGCLVQYVLVPATLWMAFLGLVQDLLRMSRWFAGVYALGIGAVAGSYLLRHGTTRVYEMLAYFCACLFMLSLLFCLAVAAYRMNNRLNARAIRRLSSRAR